MNTPTAIENLANRVERAILRTPRSVSVLEIAQKVLLDLRANLNVSRSGTGCQDKIDSNEALLALIIEARDEAQAAGNTAAVEIFNALIALQQEYIRGLKDCHGS